MAIALGLDADPKAGFIPRDAPLATPLRWMKWADLHAGHRESTPLGMTARQESLQRPTVGHAEQVVQLVPRMRTSPHTGGYNGCII
ncbi:hypothetical protein [Thermobaculum terrenum]|uniref:hypothetical protein n=1 Tax=Thermobaculum terrenum TaxID=166501 RepID=UPI000675C046|nr:hypothetical protein [Thermobaculum terrenum]